jgi:hypothetical protein
MKNIKAYLPWTIRVIIAVLFVISAIAKMYPSPYFAITTFEVKQLYSLGFSEQIAPYFSRILIGIELALGVLILQNHFLRKLIIPATILLLAVFVAHLSIETIQNGGNSGNCGCFGSLLPMTPIEAIIKNIVAIILLVALLYLMPKKDESKDNFWVLSTGTLSFILLVFMLAPIQPQSDYQISESTSEETTATEAPIVPAENTNQPVTATAAIETTATAIQDTVKKEAPKALNEPAKHKSGYAQYFSKIDNDRKILCFFVPGCEHCRVAAKELTEMKQKDKNFPKIMVLFMNEEANLIPDFFKEAGAEYPFKIIEIPPFWKLLGTNKDTPGVKYLWNGNELKYYYGINENKFNAADFKALVNKKYSEIKKK